MFRKAGQFYVCEPLHSLGWLAHGFGLREAILPEGVVTLKQIHSDIVVEITDQNGRCGEGDALVTAVPGKLIGVRTADCVPIILADDKARAVAVIHAGWRGTVSQIAIRTLEAMRARFDSEPRHVHAAIGPAIQPCCYEVGWEVAAQFSGIFPDQEDLTRIDLTEANRRLLIDAGVRATQIYTSGLCTYCHGADFYSYRRERQNAGRMTNFVGMYSEGM